MSAFNPFLYAVEGPRMGMAQPQPAAPLQSGSSERRVSVLTPIPIEIDLSTVSGFVEPVELTVYERDYFIVHSTQARVHRVHISANQAVEQPRGFALMLVSKQGQTVVELTGDRPYKTLPIEVDVVDDVFQDFEGALFLRVKSTSQNTLLYVTIEVLTGKVL